MSIGPSGGLRRLVVEKGHLQGLWGRLREHLGEQVPLPGLLLGGQLHVDGLLLLLEGDLLPGPGHRPPDLLAADAPKAGVAVDLHVGQHGVPHRGGEPPAAVVLIGPAEVVVGGGEAAALLVGPGVAHPLAHQLLEPDVAARLGELDEVDPAAPVKIDQLIVQLGLPGVRPLGQDAGHMGVDAVRLKILEDADPLVPLRHIVAVQVLIGGDGVPDALLQLGLAQLFPLEGKLRLLFHQRHKVPGEGLGTPVRLGAHHKLQRHLDGTQIHRPQQILL